MNNDSAKESMAFDRLIDRHMRRIADEVWTSSYSKHWKALALLGSCECGKNAPPSGKGCADRPFSEYNLVLVTDKTTALIQSALEHLEKRLTAELGLPVTLRPCLKKSLPKCEFSLLNYELKYGHTVIRGDEKIFERMPDYPYESIPLSEGTRRLLNCGKLLLDMQRRLALKEPLSPEERQRFIRSIFKTHLAFGDCALLVRNAYDVSYTVKKERIKQLELGGLFDARGIVNAYLRAVEFREHGDLKPLETVNVHIWFDETIRNFQDFFLWYEQRVLNRKFRNIGKYARTFPHLGNEGSPIRNAAHNLRTFGLNAFPHLFVHPRIRLYPAILLLLSNHPDLLEISRLLNSWHSAFDGLCNDFVRLQQKFP